MSRGFQSLRRYFSAAVCLLVLGAAVPAQEPVLPSGFLYYSRDYRFRVTLPARNPTITQPPPKEGDLPTTIFHSAAKGDAYAMSVVVYQLDSHMAHSQFPEYFRQFKEGMKYYGTSLDGCQQGSISDYPAERCVVSNYDGIGVMLLVRRGGVSYYVAGTQDRAHNNEQLIGRNVSSFLLLPELEPFTFQEEGFRASFPAQPKLTHAREGTGVIVQSFAAANRYMTMVVIDDLTPAQLALDDPRLFGSVERQYEQVLANVHLHLTECAAVRFVGGFPAHYCTYTDDKNAGKLLLVRHGKKLYSVLAHHPKDNGSDAEVEQFVKAFELLR